MSNKGIGNEGFFKAVGDLYPGLIEKIKNIIQNSEHAFEGKRSEEDCGFLWEHTLHVASLAFDLAKTEGIDPVLSSIVGLFHDSGKFVDGEYHKGRRPEEEGSARIAARLLHEAGMEEPAVAGVLKALRSLYDEKAGRDDLAAVVHDADFLSKFGYLGVAGFFIKSTLRGRNLHGAVMNSLSKELTYASVLRLNMRTEAGRNLAEKKSRDSLKFFRGLLRELRETHGSNYRIRKSRVVDPESPPKMIDFQLVVSSACDACGGRWKIDTSVETGIKCRRLIAHLRCAGCVNRYEISFCLPEMPSMTD